MVEDAGANIVDVRVDTNLQAPHATMAVFDNGSSMDLIGLRDLWHIAFSPKERSHSGARPPADRQIRHRKVGHVCTRGATHLHMQGS